MTFEVDLTDVDEVTLIFRLRFLGFVIYVTVHSTEMFFVETNKQTNSNLVLNISFTCLNFKIVITVTS